jgi:hypothetical protein
MHLLPETLIVHDPYKCLSADGRPLADFVLEGEKKPLSRWERGHDITHVYKLSLRPQATEAISETREKIQNFVTWSLFNLRASSSALAIPSLTRSRVKSWQATSLLALPSVFLQHTCISLGIRRLAQVTLVRV